MQITFDAVDPRALADVWAPALRSYALQPPPSGCDSWDAFLAANGVPPEHRQDAPALVGDGPRPFFQKVPEPKAAKDRVLLDVQSGSGPGVPLDEQRRRIRAEVGRLQSIGATLAEYRDGLGVAWAVLTDSEGNEFCA